MPQYLAEVTFISLITLINLEFELDTDISCGLCVCCLIKAFGPVAVSQPRKVSAVELTSRVAYEYSAGAPTKGLV